MFEFKFPDVGEGITEGKLIKWLIKENEPVKKEQSIAEIETDKAIVEIPSPVSGTVIKLLYKEQDVVYVGKPMMLIDDGTTNLQTESSVGLNSARPKINVEIAAPRTTTPVANSVPPIINSTPNTSRPIYDGEVKAMPYVRKYAKENNIDLTQIKGTGRDGSILMEDLNGNAPKISRPNINYTVTNNQSTQSTVQLRSSNSPQDFGPIDYSKIKATPSIRQYARDSDVNISLIKGTGNNGNITREDVDNAKNNVQSNKSSQSNYQQTSSSNNQSSTNYSSTQSFDSSKSTTDIPLTPIRQAIFNKMTESFNNVVPVTIMDEADVTELSEIRDKQKDKLQIKLSYLPFFVKAVVYSLQKNIKLNSSYDNSRKVIVPKNYFNIGIAVDTEFGLMVPNVKDADKKSILQINQEVSDLANKCRTRTIKMDEMSNGSFTISSVGNIVGQHFTQIINYPESAILGIGRIIEKPVVKEINGKKEVLIRKMLPLSVTIDHRLIDGADASRFLLTLINYLENPETLMLEMK